MDETTQAISIATAAVLLGYPAEQVADVGRRLAELEERTAAAKRRLAALGWTDAALDELARKPTLLCGSAPRLKAVV